MILQHDKRITISHGASRRAVNWQMQTLLISELWEKLKTPIRGSETLAEYLAMKKSEQDERKDVGGFVGGTLCAARRKAKNITGRDLITLDLDNIPAGKTEEVLGRVEELGCGYLVYSTRKHRPSAPRLRVLLPTDRTVKTEEYEPVARKVAQQIGLEFADPTTFEVSRLMYWPSCCSDGVYICRYADKPFLSVDSVLSRYADWQDMNSWPALPGAAHFTKSAAQQGDPESKSGIVGAFCRCYDIYRAMDELIPGVYEAVGHMPDRYTYTAGQTTGGAVVYENGRFLYSHHATDPCCGKLVNAFDLVRIHKFADLDEKALPETPVNRLASYSAMREYIGQLKEVADCIAKERHTSAQEEFAGIAADANTVEWMRSLDRAPQTGIPKSTIHNVLIILENDPLLRGKFALNQFAGRGEVLGALPWNEKKQRRLWEDNDNHGLYWYLEKYYQITGSGKIDGALSLHSNRFAFNEVADYLTGLIGKWDGAARLDTLIIDYLGATDTAYNRTVTRKAFTAAVARAMTPGCKYDNMVILTGPQGIGKSTLLDKMSRGWFNDSIRSFEGKEASELLQGVWLVEVAELDAFRRTDIARIKQFLSLRADRYRAAYGRHVKELPRCCVFFGTCNESEFLQDATGNRRFWPIDVGVCRPSKSVFGDLDDEVDQIWAEAVTRWQLGEELYLSGWVEQQAKKMQEEHREQGSREGIIRAFLEQKVPKDWNKWPLDRRRLYWTTGAPEVVSEGLTERDRVCAAEVWCEALGGNIKEMKNTDTREINSIIAMTPGWEKTAGTVHFGGYGSIRGFIRKNESDLSDNLSDNSEK